MLIFDTIQKTEYPLSVALGFFDGVHNGHKEIITKCVEHATNGSKSAVLTFKDSPQSVLKTISKPLLTTTTQKLSLFERLGVDVVYCVDFADIMNLSAEEFVKDILCDNLNAKTVVTGFNYHFGKGGESGADDMVDLCNKYQIDAIKCEPVLYKDAPVSSTRIRECIKHGDIEDANAMLGYEFAIASQIISGNHIGTKLKCPTLNQPLSSDIVIPTFGVYASTVTIDEKTYIGATNIGTHPTIKKTDAPVCETHILNYNGDLYGKSAHTKLHKFIRNEREFDSLDMLKAQITKDKEKIKQFFTKNRPE